MHFRRNGKPASCAPIGSRLLALALQKLGKARLGECWHGMAFAGPHFVSFFHPKIAKGVGGAKRNNEI
jgi:hypothetical protein